MLHQYSISLIGALRVSIFSICMLIAVCCGQSCGGKSSDGDNDTLPPWRQGTIDITPAWSPDGSKIIYLREAAAAGRDTAWPWGVFIHDVAAGTDTLLWPNEATTAYFSWSPDGQRIAFSREAKVYVYDFTTGITKLITDRNRNFSLSWSPCGDKVIFFVRATGGGLFYYDFATDSIVHVVDRDQAGAGDWYSNCSTMVLLDSCMYTECGVMGYNLYADSLWVISRIPGYKREISLSPDGKTIVFGIRNDLWAIGISGGEAHKLTTEGGEYPDWSPDGQWIVFTKVNLWNGYLWLMRPDGSEKHQITF